MNNFTSELDVRYVDGCTWLIMAPFTYHLGSYHGFEFVRVEQGAVTDFASIPDPLRWWWRSPGGPWDKPAVIHDRLYAYPFVLHINGSMRTVTRAEADDVFNEALAVMQVNRVTRWTLYRGVRLGGGRIWDRYRAESK